MVPVQFEAALGFPNKQRHRNEFVLQKSKTEKLVFWERLSFENPLINKALWSFRQSNPTLKYFQMIVKKEAVTSG